MKMIKFFSISSGSGNTENPVSQQVQDLVDTWIRKNPQNEILSIALSGARYEHLIAITYSIRKQ